MSQIVGFLGDNFAIIAADSNITDESGKTILIRKKLFTGDSFIITSAGISFGINIIEGLIERGKSLGVNRIEDIEDYLLTFGNNQYENFKKNQGKNLKKDLVRLYFLFAALDENDRVSLKFVGAEAENRLKTITIGDIVTAPRRIILEMNLLKSINKTGLEIGHHILNYLKNVSQKDVALKPPFDIAIIDKNGSIKYLQNY